jgi:hypothetical protein
MLPVRLAQALDVSPQSLGGEDAIAYAVAYSFATVEAQLVQHAQTLNQFLEWAGQPTARLIQAAETIVRRNWAGADPPLVAEIDELAAAVSSVRGTH